MNEQENVIVFKDTLKQIKEKYQTDTVEAKYYNGLPDVEVSVKHTPITMVHGGTVNTGYANADNMRVAILNFADALKYGGWVEDGTQTQEENICRCTNLYPVIGSEKSHEEYYAPNMRDVELRQILNGYSKHDERSEVYTDRIIYARDITVFKDDTTYADVEPRRFDVITSPSPKAYLNTADAIAVYTKRITQIILSAIDNGVECIVLGAWGCGAFGQNPEYVALSFAHVLNKYGGYFKKIIFAIKPTPHWHDTDLYDTFKSTLDRFYLEEVRDEK